MSILKEQAMVRIDETDRGLSLRVSKPAVTGEMIDISFANKQGNINSGILREAMSLISPEYLSDTEIYGLAQYLTTQTFKENINGKDITSYGAAIEIVLDDKGTTRYLPFDFNSNTFTKDGEPVMGYYHDRFIECYIRNDGLKNQGDLVTEDGFNSLSLFADFFSPEFSNEKTPQNAAPVAKDERTK